MADCSPRGRDRTHRPARRGEVLRLRRERALLALLVSRICAHYRRILLELSLSEEKYLMLDKLKYPTMFGKKGRIGFMELYIVHKLNQRMDLARGST